MWNTPPTFNVYTTGKVFDWLEAEGGIHAARRRAERRAGVIYAVIDQSQGFYSTPCAIAAHRSLMNVPFSVRGGDGDATKAFLIGAYERNMVGLRTKMPPRRCPQEDAPTLPPPP